MQLPPPGVISCAQFAKRFNKQPMAVSQAIKSGRLPNAAVYSCCWRIAAECTCTPRGRAGGIRDFDLAVKEWTDNTNPTHHNVVNQVQISEQAPAAKVPQTEITPAQAAAQEKFWKAKQAELSFRESAKELVSKAGTVKEWSDLLGSIKTKLEGVPSRLKQQLPELTLEQIAAIEDAIREALTDLADHG